MGMARYKKYEKEGWEGFWRPEGKVLDLYVMERDDKYGDSLSPENTGRLVPYLVRSVDLKSEREAREYFESDKVRT
jgi:hypothetical protein